MSREIKFRGRRINNGEWVYGCYAYHKVPLTDAIDHFIVVNGLKPYSIDPETVGQYVGLKDKNKKEIYEGDIVRNHRNLDYKELIVCRWQEALDDGRWTIEKPGFRFERINGVGTTIWVANKHFEVIGNIYEHPHLLGGENNG
jgi:uncharacterized phage protein (TIGR01671 family)